MDEDDEHWRFLSELARLSIEILHSKGLIYAIKYKLTRVGQFLTQLSTIQHALEQLEPDPNVLLSVEHLEELLGYIENVCSAGKSHKYQFPELISIKTKGDLSERIVRKMTSYLSISENSQMTITKLVTLQKILFSSTHQAQDAQAQKSTQNLDDSRECPSHVHKIFGEVIERYKYCGCVPESRAEFNGWLQLGDHLPSVAHYHEDEEVVFEAIFTHARVEQRGGDWKHLAVQVPCRTGRRVGFSETGSAILSPSNTSHSSQKKHMKTAEFCQLLLTDIGPAKRRLRADGTYLTDLEKVDDPGPLFKNEEEISLSEALQWQTKKLTDEGKISLAFILAKSAWQYYESSFMSSLWMAYEVHFVPQDDSGQTKPKYDPLSPFISIGHGQSKADCALASLERINGLYVHKYPRILALGIALISIFWTPVQPQTEWVKEQQINWPYQKCTAMLNNSSPQLEGQAKLVAGIVTEAVRSCFDCKRIPNDPNSSARRSWLLENVVKPLEKLVKHSGLDRNMANWIEVPLKIDAATQASKGLTISPGLKEARKNAFQAGELLLLNDDYGHEEKVPPRLAQAATEWINNLVPLFLMVPEVSKSPIKVAILDTGLAFDEDIAKKYYNRLEAYCFVQNAEEPQACNEDRDGHGTHMASIILETGVNCKIYACRICTIRNEVRSQHASKHTAERIAKAIRYAVDNWGVDIISMSFGFENKSSAIEAAVEYAYSKRVLVFGAAGNSGILKQTAYPARDPHVVCIGAATGLGGAYDGNPTNKVHDQGFAFLGVAVEGWPCADKGNEGCSEPKKIRRSGTSQATAVGAGLAAFILQLMRYSEQEAESVALKRTYASALSMLRQRYQLCRVFTEMCADNSPTAFQIVKPWRVLPRQQSTTRNMRDQVCQRIIDCLDWPPEWTTAEA